jgi:hypothetical protein
MRPVNDPDRLLNGLELPVPSKELRDRALTAARAAGGTSSDSDLWNRLWTSPPLRLAWAASVAGLVLAHLALSLPARRTGPSRAGPLLTAGVVADTELAEVVELPRINAKRLPQLDTPFSGRSHQPSIDERRPSDEA